MTYLHAYSGRPGGHDPMQAGDRRGALPKRKRALSRVDATCRSSWGLVPNLSVAFCYSAKLTAPTRRVGTLAKALGVSGPSFSVLAGAFLFGRRCTRGE